MTVRGINKVIIVVIWADPEVRYMPNGGAVANLSLATSESPAINRPERCAKTPNGIAWYCLASSRKWPASICARALRCTSKGSYAPATGRTTAA